MNRTSHRTRTLVQLVACASVTSLLFISQGCAKWNKRHNHSHTPVFGTYPASAPQQPGLASVSPQSGPVLLAPMAQPQSAGYPAASPFANNQQPMPDTPPLITNPAAETPAPAAPPVAAPTATIPTPPPVAVEPPAIAPAPVQLPANNPKPAAAPAPTAAPAPPAAKPADELPPKVQEKAKSATTPPATPGQPAVPAIESLLPPPASLPPPAELPKSVEPFPTPREQPKSAGNAQPASPTGSPFANNGSQKVANSQPVLSLSIPGSEAPPAAPAEEKSPQLLAPPTQDAPANSPGAGGLKPAPEPGIISSGVSKPASNSPVAALDEALRRTSATLAQTTNYKVQVSNQETLNGKTLPADTFMLNARRQPFAVRMEWSNGKEAGREVIFSPAETGGMIQIRMPKGLIPRMTMSPDSPLVRAKSRHPISEAGIDSVVERLNLTLQKLKSGSADAGQLDVQQVTDPHLGEQIRITHRTVTNETWVVDLDKVTGLPLTIHATDAAGGLLEHYEFRNFQLNQADLLTADAFDPNARWGSKTNLFGKIARGKEDTVVK